MKERIFSKSLYKFFVALIISVILSMFLNISSFAKSDGDFSGKVMLHANSTSPKILMKGDVMILSPITTVNIGGKEYYAYCVDLDKKGPEIIGNYEVDVIKELDDKKIHSVLRNGFPNRSLEELGVNSIDEAYTATKQAVYSIMYNRDISQYSPGYGDSGIRTYNALKKILENARKDISNPKKSGVTIETLSDWKYIDGFIQKRVKIKSEYYGEVNLKADNNVKILDKSGKEVSKVTTNTEVIIQKNIEELNNKGKITLEASAKLETFPVLYAATNIEGSQNFAIAGFKSRGISKDVVEYNYDQNNTKIEIFKIDEKDKKPLVGVKFELLDSNKKKIIEKETDSNGKIYFDNLKPGKYYIKEIKTNPGYALLEGEKEVLLNFQQIAKITVGNNKIVRKEYEKSVVKYSFTSKKEIPTNRYRERVLPNTGM